MNQPNLFSFGLILLFIAIFNLSTVLAIWDDYDKCANDTLSYETPDSCLFGSTSFVADQQGNACLCPKKVFIENVAKSLYRYCGCDVLQSTANTFVENCNRTS